MSGGRWRAAITSLTGGSGSGVFGRVPEMDADILSTVVIASNYCVHTFYSLCVLTDRSCRASSTLAELYEHPSASGK